VITDGLEEDPEYPDEDHPLSLGSFKHNYIVPNASLVLPTHTVDFALEDTHRAQVDPAVDLMPLLSVKPESLDAQYREQALEVCDPALVQHVADMSQGGLQRCLGESYQQLWQELESLSSGLRGLEDTLEASYDNVEQFKQGSLMQAEQLKDAMVGYLSHSTLVQQALNDEQFELNRLVSDTQRLQELHLHLRKSLTREQLVVVWPQLEMMRATLGMEVSVIVARAPLHDHTMALTTHNKRVVGLRREAMLRDQVIERLAESLRQRGLFNEDDEELISGF